MAREPKKLEAELAKSRPAIDRELIRELARLLDETGLTEIEFERDGARVRVARHAYARPVALELDLGQPSLVEQPRQLADQLAINRRP